MDAVLGPRLPHFIPHFDGVRFSDLARAIDAIYRTGKAPEFERLLTANFGGYRVGKAPGTIRLGVEVTTYSPVANGPIVVLLQGANGFAHSIYLPAANQFDFLATGDVYGPFRTAARQTGEALTLSLDNGAQPQGIIIGAHSLGGAVAEIVGEEIVPKLEGWKINVTTFGAPRVYLASSASTKGGPWLWRFANSKDAVTALPNFATSLSTRITLGSVGVIHPAASYAQLRDGVLLSESRLRYNVVETFDTDIEAADYVIAWATGLGTRAQSEHAPLTYARRLDNLSLELVSREQQLVDLVQLPMGRDVANQLERQGGFMIPPFMIEDENATPAPPIVGTVNPAATRQARNQAAIRGGPGGWALSAPKLNNPIQGARAIALDATMAVTIPKEFRWSYAKVGGQHWASWTGRTIVQCQTKASATLYCRRANQALRRLQHQLACDIDAYPQAWIEYLAAATNAGNGFAPVLTVAS